MSLGLQGCCKRSWLLGRPCQASSFCLLLFSFSQLFFSPSDSLFPLFPGANELDQINKIHEILGSPPAHVLAKIRKNSPNLSAKFPEQRGKGAYRSHRARIPPRVSEHRHFMRKPIEKLLCPASFPWSPSSQPLGLESLLPNASPELIDVMKGLLEYDPDVRLSARQALKHPYFKDLRDEDKRQARAAQHMSTSLGEAEAALAATSISTETAESADTASLAASFKQKFTLGRRSTKQRGSLKGASHGVPVAPVAPAAAAARASAESGDPALHQHHVHLTHHAQVQPHHPAAVGGESIRSTLETLKGEGRGGGKRWWL